MIPGKSEGELRGCIGITEPIPLKQGLEEYAIIAGFQDHRFPSLELSELPNLSCTVTLLRQFEEVDDLDDWTVGTHGIQIHFKSQTGRTMRAIYLPQVMPEQGWTKEEALVSAVQKAGFRGPFDEVKDRIKLTRFQAEIHTLKYKDIRR